MVTRAAKSAGLIRSSYSKYKREFVPLVSILGAFVFIAGFGVILNSQNRRTAIAQVDPVIVDIPSEAKPNQVIVKFSHDASEADKAAYIEQIHGTVSSDLSNLDSVIVNVPAGTIADLPKSPIASSEPDYLAVALDSNDPLYSQQWALPVIKAAQGWAAIPANADKIKIAVVDSGICATHPDLTGHIIAGWDFVENDAVPQDDMGHGCGVAGVIAASVNNNAGIAGVATNVEIMPIRVLDGSGIGTYSNVAAGIIYAADHGAKIINLSLGGTNASTVLEDAVNYATNKGVLVVAAAGNTGTSSLLYPAKYNNVIAVGSIDSNLQRSSFSSYGSKIGFWAPGGNILTTNKAGDYAAASGTSFAAPYVSGVLALRITAGKNLVPDSKIIAFDPTTDQELETNVVLASASVGGQTQTVSAQGADFTNPGGFLFPWTIESEQFTSVVEGSRGYHEGAFDFIFKNGTDDVSGVHILAPKDGVVVDFNFDADPNWTDCLDKAGSSNSWVANNYVVLGHGRKHADGKYDFYSLYYHMLSQNPGISLNQHVPIGTVIGFVGNTGSGDAPHLHFGVNKDIYFNPNTQVGQCGTQRVPATGTRRVPVILAGTEKHFEFEEYHWNDLSTKVGQTINATSWNHFGLGDNCDPESTAGVIIYEHSFYGGKCRGYNGDTSENLNIPTFGSGLPAVSSILVNQGWSAGLKDQLNWQGSQLPFSGITAADDQPDFAKAAFPGGGNWNDKAKSIKVVHGLVCMANVDGQSACGIPDTPTPDLPPTPPANGSYNFSESSYPTLVEPNQKFTPSVKVCVVNGSMQQSRGDMLRNTDSKLYGAFPHVSVVGTINNGQCYTFTFYDPMQAPASPGTYTSKWQLWINGTYVANTEWTIQFTVGSTGGGTPSGNTVILYDGENSSGNNLSFAAGSYDISSNWDNRAKSINVGNGMSVKLFPDPSYGGSSLCVSGSTGALPNGYYNAVSSLKVYNNTTCQDSSVPTFCGGVNLIDAGGTSLLITSSVDNLSTLGWNDRPRMIEVQGPFQVTTYDDYNLQGYSHGPYGSGTYTGVGTNTSSVRVTQTGSCNTGGEYPPQCSVADPGVFLINGGETYKLTSSSANLATIGWNDKPRQIRVSGPYRVNVYDSDNFTGYPHGPINDGQTMDVGTNVTSVKVDVVVDCTHPITHPDLIPASRPGASAPVVGSLNAGTKVQDTLSTERTTYLSWGYSNMGNADVNSSYHVKLWIDDQLQIDYPFTSIGQGQLGGFDDWGISWTTPGCFNVKMIVDANAELDESNEANNTWSGIMCWKAPAVTFSQVFMTDVNGPGAATVGNSIGQSAQGMQSSMTTNQFNAGDSVREYIEYSSDFVATQDIQVTWKVLDPLGRKVDAMSYDLWNTTVSTGGWWAWLGPTIPGDAMTGTYTYIATIVANGRSESQSFAFHVNGRNTVQLVDAYVLDGNGNSAAQFSADDNIQFHIYDNNNLGSAQTAYFKWHVTDQNGNDVPSLAWEGDLTVADGSSVWYLPTKLPDYAGFGTYHFNAEIDYDTFVYTKSVAFDVGGANPVVDALFAIYNSTGGASWTSKSGWLMNNYPCTWYGITCTNGNITSLALWNNNLTGSIPSEIGSLKHLQTLDLSANHLAGSLPASMGNLQDLQYLYLGYNRLTGQLPSELGNLQNLFYMWLSGNVFTGTIPTSFGNMAGLNYLYLWDNQVSGSIPTELGNLQNLQVLSLGYNLLTGSIPTSLGNIPNLQSIYLNNNFLSGTIPSELGSLNNLSVLNLWANQLSGSVPASIWNRTSLNELNLGYNQLTGSISTQVGSLTNLFNLILNNNQFSGTIPSQIGNLAMLTTLDLSSNQLQDDVPLAITQLTSATSLRIDANHLRVQDPAVIAFLNNIDPTWSTSQTPLDAQELVRNGSFNNIEWHWGFWGEISHQATGGVMNVYRQNPSANGASMFQTLNFTSPANYPYIVTALVGNTSAATKHFNVILRDSSSWTGAMVCNFSIPANTSPAVFYFKSKTTSAWQNMNLEVQPLDADGLSSLTLDNLSVNYNAAGTPSGVECHSPTFAPPADQNIVSNGTFTTNDASWNFWGEVTHNVTSGVLSFFRQNPSPNGASIFQDMQYPLVSGSPLQIDLDLANTSAVTKTVGVVMRDSNSWGDFISCTFSIPANTSSKTYTVQGKANSNWANMRLEVMPNQPDGLAAITMDNVSVKYSPSLVVSSTNCKSPLTANQNMVRNGDFSSGESQWNFWGEVNHAVNSGVEEFNRAASSPNGAAIFQDLNNSLTSGSPLELNLSLGNSSAVTKQVGVILRPSDSWSDFVVCTFTIPANSALQTYTVRGKTASTWNNIRYEIDTNTADGLGNVRMDNVDVQYKPALVVNSTTCTSPATLPANTNMITNGTFTTNEAGWSFWGDITHSIASGSLAAYRQNPGTNGAAIFQDQAYPVPTGSPFEVRVDLANTSAVDKQVGVILRPTDSWSDFIVCTFTVRANTTTQTYTMQGKSAMQWNNFRYEMDINNSDGLPNVLFDNVDVQYKPALSVSGTNCISPSVLPSNVNVLTNSAFTTNDAGWSYWGEISHVWSSGVVSIHRQNPSMNGAAMFQNATYAAAINSPFELTLNMANPSAATKSVGVSIKDPNGWTGAITCTFLIPANTLSKTYTIRGKNSAAWQGLQAVINPNDQVSTGDITIDNVNLQYKPALVVSGTTCTVV